MSIEHELKTLILEKYKSIRAFSINLELPNSTMDTILKRGISGTAISTVIKICNALEIDVNSLADGQIKPKPFVSKLQYSFEEEEHIKKYRTLDEHGKRNVDNILQNEYERCADSNIITLQEFPASYKVHTLAAHECAGATDEDKQHDYDLLEKIQKDGRGGKLE